jgi:MFS family permease
MQCAVGLCELQQYAEMIGVIDDLQLASIAGAEPTLMHAPLCATNAGVSLAPTAKNAGGAVGGARCSGDSAVAPAASRRRFWLSVVVPQYIGGVLGIEPARIGLIYALPWMFGTILLVALGFGGRHIMRRGGSARWGVAGLFGCSLVASGICLLLLPHASGLLAMALMTVGWGAFLVFPMAPTAVAYAVNPSQRAGVISTLVGLASVGGVIALAVVGWFVQKAGYITPKGGGMGDATLLAQGLGNAFTLTGLLLFVAGLAAVLLINPERTAERLQQDARSA